MISVFRRGGDPHLVFLTMLLTVSLAFGAAPVGAAQPTVELPKEISGAVGDQISVTAKSSTGTVKWVVMEKNGFVVFPGELKNPLQTVITLKRKGTYRLLAYTGDAGGASEPTICVVKIEKAKPDPDDPDVPPEPGPGPTPPPGPVDPLTTELSKIYIGITEADKADSLIKLVALYEQIPNSLGEIKTVGTLKKFVTVAAGNVLPSAKIKPIRDRLNVEMMKEMPLDPKANVDVPALTAIFNKYAKILKGIKP